MTRSSHALRAGLAALAAGILTIPAFADIRYTVQTLPFDGDSVALNNAGQVAGYISNGPQGAGAYLMDGGGSLHFMGDAVQMSIFSMNNRGDAVWASPDWNLEADPTYFYDGQKKSTTLITPLPFYPGSINDSRQVSGISGYRAGYSLPAAAIWQPGAGMQVLPGLEELGPPAIVSTINNNGQLFASLVDGMSYLYTPNKGLKALPAGQRGVVVNDEGNYVVFNDHDHMYQFMQAGVRTDIVDTNGWVVDLNNEGTVLGNAYDQGYADAFIVDKTGKHSLASMIDPTLKLTLGNAWALNDRGQVLAFGFDGAGGQYAYMLTPVPEPSAPVMVLLGGLMVAFWRRGRMSTAVG